MQSSLADFIERHTEAIVQHAIAFARTVKVDTPLDEVALRDHLPGIVGAVVEDLRTTQTRAQEIEKSEGRAVPAAGAPRSTAATHALHRAHSGYTISQLVSEYRALRASVMRLWAEDPVHASVPREEITRFNEAIDEAIAESVSYYAAEVERWRNIFLGALGHDLRSPLGAIVMTSELIARMAVDAPIADAAQRLIRSGERMRSLLDRLLVYNRANIGIGFELEKSAVDLARECGEEIDLLRAAMPDVQIHYEAPAAMPGHFDAPRVREALANLVVNAHKYGTRGARIDVVLTASGPDVELSVANLGEQIPTATLDTMFEPLRRVGVTTGEAERASLGLGLFIVDQIARAHAGSIGVDSGDGTTIFRLRLPKE